MRMNILLKATTFLLLIIFAAGTAPTTEGRERSSRSSGTSGHNQYGTVKPDMDISRLERKIHDLINQERKAKKLSALAWSDGLKKIARKYSEEMARRNFFSHNDPEGRSFMDRYREGGFTCKIKFGNSTCLGAENIAQDNLYNSWIVRDGKRVYDWNTEDEIARSIVKRWMGSKGHRENILTPYFRQQGVGIAVSEDGGIYVTENFC